MLSGLSSITPTIQTSNSTAQPTVPRSGRLRSLSYLRSYSHAGDRVNSHIAQSPPSNASSVHPVAAPLAAVIPAPNPELPVESTWLRSRIAARRHRSTSSSGASHATGGWIPFVNGSAGPTPAQAHLQPAPITLTTRRTRQRPLEESPPRAAPDMTRHRSVTTPHMNLPDPTTPPSIRAPDWSGVRVQAPRRTSGPAQTTAPSAENQAPQHSLPVSQLPSIRFVPYQDPRSPRPSLNFATATRTLPNSNAIIRVGRYSEKDSAPPPGSADVVSDAPLGFKSKVVSRRHCEFYYQDNQWYIKDAKSSSGTFLNHIRLSPPGEESRPYAIKDGDLVQLGIDFKGGEEMIFRCVKIRILCNRGWQKSLNKFSKSAHKHLNEMQRGSGKLGEVSQNSTECTICLNSIMPRQSLFVAPCMHTWHYKCIRPMLDDVRRTATNESHFTCPNCRNVADLDADIDESPLWEDSDVASQAADDASLHGLDVTHIDETASTSAIQSLENNMSAGLTTTAFADSASDTSTSRRSLNPSASNFIPVSPGRGSRTLAAQSSGSAEMTAFPLSDDDEGDDEDGMPTIALDPVDIPSRYLGRSLEQEGPLTPRNHAGPFVFDGTASTSPLPGAAPSGGPINGPQ